MTLDVTTLAALTISALLLVYLTLTLLFPEKF
jgi:K+-transporting ATPase KdpF subunit